MRPLRLWQVNARYIIMQSVGDAPQDLDCLQQCVCRDAGAQTKAGRLALWRAESLGCNTEALGEPWIFDIEAPGRLWICNLEAFGGFGYVI